MAASRDAYFVAAACKTFEKCAAARGRRAVADASEQRRAARARADGGPAWKKRASPIAKDVRSVIDLAE